MQVCEEALKNMKNSKRRPIKGTLHISGDGLRVSDSETKGLVLDQTIEKVSFCAPDRNYDKGFSYICRDGTTRRWLCHGFMAVKDSGERLSHAVGCAFAICLEKKQRRDKECAVQMQYDHQQNTFTRFGSFRQGTISDRLQDPQTFKPLDLDRPPVLEPFDNPNAVARPKASDLMYLRQASFRGFGGKLSDNSPFKRQFSLRLSELPSTLARQAQDSDKVTNQSLASGGLTNHSLVSTNPGLGLAGLSQFSPIREDPPESDLLSPDLIMSPTNSHSQGGDILLPTQCSTSPAAPLKCSPTPAAPATGAQEAVKSPSFNPWDNVPDQPLSRSNHSLVSKPASERSVMLQPSANQRPGALQPANESSALLQRPSSMVTDSMPLDDWLSSHQLSNLTLVSSHQNHNDTKSRPPPLASVKSHSFDQPSLSSSMLTSSKNHNNQTVHNDPFDADWVGLALRDQQSGKSNNTNPFLKQDSLKQFELQM